MLYNDMDNRVMLYYTAKKGDADPHDIPAGPLVQSYRLRLVSERNELIEKIHLTDVGIDDCAMELFKTALRDSLESKAEDQLYFSGLGKEGDTQQVMHFVLFTTQGTETLTIKRESFDELEKNFAPLLKQNRPPLGQWFNISRQYAENLVR